MLNRSEQKTSPWTMMSCLGLAALTLLWTSRAEAGHDYYWAKLGTTESVVDVIALPDDGGGDLEALAGRYVGLDGEPAAIPAGAKELPDRFARGRTLQLISPKGPVRLRVRGHRIEFGASEVHLEVLLEGAPRLAGLDALVVQGEAPANARLRAVPSLRAPRGGWSALSAAVRRSLGGKEELHWGPGTTQLVSARFPGGRQSFVTYAEPLDDPTTYVTALLFLDEEGTPDFLQRPRETLERLVPRYVVDTDGDGLDELVVSSEYYEGDYLHLIRWEQAEPRFVTLTGDGA